MHTFSTTNLPRCGDAHGAHLCTHQFPFLQPAFPILVAHVLPQAVRAQRLGHGTQAPGMLQHRAPCVQLRADEVGQPALAERHLREPHLLGWECEGGSQKSPAAVEDTRCGERALEQQLPLPPPQRHMSRGCDCCRQECVRVRSICHSALTKHPGMEIPTGLRLSEHRWSTVMEHTRRA